MSKKQIPIITRVTVVRNRMVMVKRTAMAKKPRLKKEKRVTRVRKVALTPIRSRKETMTMTTKRKRTRNVSIVRVPKNRNHQRIRTVRTIMVKRRRKNFYTRRRRFLCVIWRHRLLNKIWRIWRKIQMVLREFRFPTQHPSVGFLDGAGLLSSLMLMSKRFVGIIKILK